ncbi:MAG: hypothetical protein HY976_02845 [Candidatus Kerfeldbacteria bacterium]|nr:hypothetical protein [Candidatus Kerfeldbacteria bacterium]
MIILIDTTRWNDIRVGAAMKKVLTLHRTYDRPGSHLVPLLDEFLKQHRLRVRQATAIFVATGPGPFSAIRSGVSVANALGLALSVPVVGVAGALTMSQLLKLGRAKLPRAKVGVTVVPTYGRPPNITPAKKK